MGGSACKTLPEKPDRIFFGTCGLFEMAGVNQAIVHVVHNGGARSQDRLNGQFKYLTRDGAILGERSTRYGTTITLDELENCANNWIRQNGAYPKSTSGRESKTDLTTHIVVSLPVDTDRDVAKQIGREWASELFASGDYGGVYDYIAFFHDDRPHPHTHIVVNRKPLRGETLCISHRNTEINYDIMREKLAEIAMRHGVLLDATSRESRGLPPSNISTARYRMLLRQGVVVREHQENEESNTNYYIDDPDLFRSPSVSLLDSDSPDDDSCSGDSSRPPSPDIYGSDQGENYDERMDDISGASSAQVEADIAMGDDDVPQSLGDPAASENVIPSEIESDQPENEGVVNETATRRRDKRKRADHVENDINEKPSKRRAVGADVQDVAEQEQLPIAESGSGPVRRLRRSKGERIRRKAALMARLRDTPARREHRRTLKLELIERRKAEHAKIEAERIVQIEKRYGKLRETKERKRRAATMDRGLEPRLEQQVRRGRMTGRDRTS